MTGGSLCSGLWSGRWGCTTCGARIEVSVPSVNMQYGDMSRHPLAERARRTVDRDIWTRVSVRMESWVPTGRTD